MAIKSIAPDVYAIPLGIVNAFLIDQDGLTLIDTGAPGQADTILRAVESLGKHPTDIKHILLTHCHADHTGNLATLVAATHAQTWMHPTDAALVQRGQVMRPLTPAPGLLNTILFRLFIKTAPTAIEPLTIDHEIQDNQELPVAGGVRTIHVPGHCAGQVAFIWPHHGGVLFVGDAAAHILPLAPSIAYEDYAEGLRSLAKLATRDYDVACFGHGKAITRNAAQHFRQKWKS